MAREERRSKRNPMFQAVQYFLVPSIIEKTCDGVITDISDSGICLLTTSPLKERQRIIMLDKSRLLERAAIVRWSQKYDDMFYKIGLEFIEDQTFMNIKDKRRYKRLRIKNLNINGKMASAHYIKIVDISLRGLLIETDTKWNIGEEYILRVEYAGKLLPVKGYVVWSRLKELKHDNKGNTVPIYDAGMKLTSPLKEIRQLLSLIELRLKQGKENRFFSVSPDGADMWGEDIKCLKSAKGL
jgi:Tfp pilus assembly protein PilZ